jgi:hypothetical protein
MSHSVAAYGAVTAATLTRARRDFCYVRRLTGSGSRQHSLRRRNTLLFGQRHNTPRRCRRTVHKAALEERGEALDKREQLEACAAELLQEPGVQQNAREVWPSERGIGLPPR